MKKLSVIIIAMAAVIFSACSNKTENAENTDNNIAEAMNIDAVVAQAPELVDSLISIEGVCTHTCKHGAKKMFLVGDSTTLRVEAGSLGAFDTKVINNLVNVKGRVKEDRIDEAYLAQLEEQIKANAAEKHGETEAGCSHDNAANNVSANTAEGQIAQMRAQIAERIAKEGKPYLSRYYVLAESYEIAE